MLSLLARFLGKDAATDRRAPGVRGNNHRAPYEVRISLNERGGEADASFEARERNEEKRGESSPPRFAPDDLLNGKKIKKARGLLDNPSLGERYTSITNR